MSGSKRLQEALDLQQPCGSKQARLEDENNNTILSTTNESNTNDSIAAVAVAEGELPARLSNANRVSLTNRPRSSLPLFPGRESSTNDSILNASRLVHDNSIVRTQLESLELILSKQFNPQLAFNYDFINHVSEFIRRGPVVDMKLLARALQAATKLYTSKVDLYIRDATKISSTLSMITEEEENELDFDDNNRNNNNNNRRRRVKKSGQTLVSNLATINCREVEVNQLADPLFHHVSTDFEVGNVNCLLMPTLHTDSNGLILFRSEDNLDFSSLPLLPRQMINTLDQPWWPTLRGLFTEDNSETRSTCAPFSSFDFLNRELNQQVEFNQQQSSPLMRPFDDYQFDLDAQTEDVTNAVDDFNFDEIGEIDNDDFGGHRRTTVDDAQIINQNLNLLEILPDNENHFFNRNFLKRRFRKASAFVWLHRNVPAPNISRSSSLSSVAPARHRRQRQSWQPNTYQLFEADDESFGMLNPNLEDQRKTRHVNKTHNYDHRMAHDRGFQPIKLRQFFTKKQTFFKKFVPARGNGVDDRSDPPYDDSHEEINLVDDIFDEYISPGDISADANGPYTTPSGPPAYPQELDYVDPLDIDYVKVAKRIDMKRVKRCIWNAIQSESIETSSMSSELAISNLPSSSASTSGKMISFEKLNQRLPAYMDANVHQNLSLANKFVALLHLCNDKSLVLGPQEPELQQQQIRSDFNIFSELS